MVISNDFCRQKNDRYLPEMCFYFLRDWCIRVGTWCASLDFQRSEISHVCLRLQQGFSSKTKHGPVESSVLSCLMIISMAYGGKDTRSTYPYSMFAGEAFSQLPRFRKSWCHGWWLRHLVNVGKQQNLEVYLWNSLKHLDFDISTHENVSFHWICVCVVY